MKPHFPPTINSFTMKKITLNAVHAKDMNSIFTADRKHNVLLGNNVIVFFKDKKKALAFLVATNDFLNAKLYELNSLYIDVFSEYRKTWFNFFNPTDSRMKNLGPSDLFNELETVEKKINFIVARAGYANGPFIVWQGFRVSIDSLNKVIKVLAEISQDKKRYSEAHQLRVIQSRIKILSNELDAWGRDAADKKEYN